MYLPEPGNWPPISENSVANLDNLSEEAISESNQIKGYLQYWMITSQNIPSEAQDKDFFVS